MAGCMANSIQAALPDSAAFRASDFIVRIGFKSVCAIGRFPNLAKT